MPNLDGQNDQSACVLESKFLHSLGLVSELCPADVVGCEEFVCSLQQRTDFSPALEGQLERDWEKVDDSEVILFCLLSK